MQEALFVPKPTFFQWKINIFVEKPTFLIKTPHGILILAQGFSLTLPHRQRQRQINILIKNVHLCISCFIELGWSWGVLRFTLQNKKETSNIFQPIGKRCWELYYFIKKMFDNILANVVLVAQSSCWLLTRMQWTKDQCLETNVTCGPWPIRWSMKLYISFHVANMF